MPNPARSLAARLYSARLVLVVLLAAAFAAQSATPAFSQNVPRAYAGIVVDAKTGQTLYQENARNLRYPASLTKVMTLYILFQELEAGRISLNTRFSVSAHAAAAVPTKLYVQRGSTISVEDSIKALVTLSANDVARVVAENISGTESQFAQRMTQTARALGMSQTTYRNASGLPDRGQVTTAADQAILARAVFQHFPTYYNYFQTRSFTYGSRTYGNHNRLLGQNGVDGIKTGYINASGYNLMTAARQNNRHIVVIGLGFNTGAARNARVAELVRSHLPRARQGDYWREAMIARPGLSGSAVAVASRAVPLGAPPPRRPNHLLPQMPPPEAMQAQVPAAPAPAPAAPVVAASVQTAAVTPPARPEHLVPENIPFQVVSADELPARIGGSALEQATYVATGTTAQPSAPLYPANDPIGAWINETLRLNATETPRATPVPPAPIGRPAGLDARVTNSSDAAPVSGWVVQVGAAPSEDGANRLIAAAAGRVDTLGDLRSYVERFERNGQILYRARFAGFADRGQARSACDALTAANVSCLAIQG